MRNQNLKTLVMSGILLSAISANAETPPQPCGCAPDAPVSQVGEPSIREGEPVQSGIIGAEHQPMSSIFIGGCSKKLTKETYARGRVEKTKSSPFTNRV